MKKPTCSICGAETQYGNLYCSVQHAAAIDDKHWTAARDLKAAGFEPTDTLNIFTKNGVSVTLERTVSLGVDKTILQHGHVGSSEAQ